MRRSKVLIGAGTLLSCCWGSLAGAQTAGSSDVADSGELQEVIVTAERRTEDVQKTAIPITVISGEQVAAKGQTEVDEVLRDAPSVQIQSAPQGADIIIRGVGGNDAGGIALDPDVSVFQDGVYSGLTSTTIGQVYDLQRVEVLRGPQGTLYGRNSAGGAINILTNDPGKTFAAGANVNFGNLSERHGDAYLNLPVSDTLAFRLAVDREERDGYYTNNGGNVDNTGARLKAKWTPSESFSLVARADYWRSKNLTTTAPTSNAPCLPAPPGAPPTLLCLSSANPGNPWETKDVAGSIFQVDPFSQDSQFYTYSVQADADLGFGTLTLIPSYSRSIVVGNTAGLFAPASPPYTTTTITGKQYTYEARLSSPAASTFKWVVGAYALKNDANQYGGAIGGVTETFYAVQSSNRRPTSSYAGFAQGTLPITTQLRATLGARYTVDEKSVYYGVCSSTDGINCGPSSTGAGTYISPAGNIKNRYSATTFKAGLEYDLTPSAMGYAQVSTGYKAGGYSTATFPPTPYQPEKLTDFEIGIKSQWFDNRLQLNADVYLYQYHDQQIELHPLIPWTGIIPIQYVPATWQPGGAEATANPNTSILDVNAGNSRYEGIESQLKYQLTVHDQIGVSAAYNHAVYGHFVINTTGGPPGTGYTTPNFDLTGKQEAHAPLWSGNLDYQHVWDLSQGTLTFAAQSRWQTSTYTTIQEWFADGNTVQGSYHMTDADLRYSAPSDKWSIGLWGKNLENKAVVNYVYPLYRQTLDIGRTYGINASIKY